MGSIKSFICSSKDLVKPSLHDTETFKTLKLTADPIKIYIIYKNDQKNMSRPTLSLSMAYFYDMRLPLSEYVYFLR